MPSNPQGSDSRVNQLLTDYSVGVLQDAAGFAHRRMFPTLPSKERGGFIGRYDRSDWLRNQFAQRPDGGESAGSGWKQDNSLTFFAKVWALHKDVGKQAQAMAQSPYDALRDATTWLMQQALISREVEWRDKFFATSIWKGIDGTVGDVTGIPSGSPSANQLLQWDKANSTPIKDLRYRMTQIQKRSAKRPNKLALSRPVWDVLADHTDVLTRILNSGGVSPSSPAIVLQQALAAILELDEIVVMDGVYATSAEKAAVESGMVTDFIGGKHALLLFVEDNPTMYTPSAGLVLPWTGYDAGAASEEGTIIEDFEIREKKVTRVEAEMAYSMVITQPDAGVFFSGAIS